mmetsp:Transcript_55963/g.149253  ORF Transcript_55963/g.149253 Transcript_55963/m.149253 type:complete len:171 (+) Transcript_55963:2504-3016(+)
MRVVGVYSAESTRRPGNFSVRTCSISAKADDVGEGTAVGTGNSVGEDGGCNDSRLGRRPTLGASSDAGEVGDGSSVSSPFAWAAGGTEGVKMVRATEVPGRLSLRSSSKIAEEVGEGTAVGTGSSVGEDGGPGGTVDRRGGDVIRAGGRYVAGEGVGVWILAGGIQLTSS